MRASITLLMILSFWIPALGDSVSQRLGQVPISNFHEIKPGVYRGARPEAVGLNAIAKLGVKTIINIDNDEQAIEIENNISNNLGMNMILIPLSGFWAPSDEDIDQILALLNDSSLYPIFLHCKHGRDRTGLVSALYRVIYQNWNPAKAYKEMLDLGFRKELVFLNHYYEERTGFED